MIVIFCLAARSDHEIMQTQQEAANGDELKNLCLYGFRFFNRSLKPAYSNQHFSRWTAAPLQHKLHAIPSSMLPRYQPLCVPRAWTQ